MRFNPREMNSALLRLVCISLITLGLASCDSAPGLDEDSGTPPDLESFTFSPSLVVFEALPESQIIDDNTARIELDLNVDIADADNDVETVSFIVRSPINPYDIVAEGELTGSGGSGTYVGIEELLLPKGSIGKYTILVFATDAKGNISNQARGSLDFQTEGGDPPVILAITAPDSVARPASDQPATLVSIVAEVTDPDGLDNIANVVLRTISNQEFPLLDDGGADGSPSGDLVQGDGMYTITIQVESTNALGPNTFFFQATDRSGFESNIVEKTLTIIQ